MFKNKHPNKLVEYRERLRFTQREVATLLGCKTTGMISRLEAGYALPNLVTALRLAALYRVPVDFLFHQLYVKFRQELRAKEGIQRPRRQGVLF